MSNKIDIFRRTAILEKGGVFAAIGLYSYTDKLHAVANYDPRCGQNAFYRRSFETRPEAVEAHHQYVALSRDRGWTVLYNGPANYG